MTFPRLPGRAAVVLAGALALAPAAATAQDELRDTYGDWQVRCAQGTENCVIAQVGQGPEGNDVLEVRVRKLQGVEGQNGEKIPAAIQILAPLGVNLKAGVRVKVDDNELRAAPFEVCAQQGCVVREPMAQAFVEEMKAGRTARVTIVAVPANEIEVPISLSGFTRAFSEIRP